MPGLSFAEGSQAGPLDILTRRLLARAPPMVGSILSAVVPYEGFAEFVALVQEFVPEHMADILSAQRPAGQIALFGNYFRDQYFPIVYSDNWMDPEVEYTDLLRHIPIHYYYNDE